MGKKVVLCLSVILCVSAMALVGICEGASGIRISFDYQRMSTIASNQFAVWIENNDGEIVRTLFVTGFTGVRRGYRNREMSLPRWVSAAAPDTMTDEALDAVSGATPQEGELEYVWDFIDDNGNPIPDGKYRIFVEGSLYWESEILFSAELELEQGNIQNLTAVQVERNGTDQDTNAQMLTNVEVAVMNLVNDNEDNTENWLGGLTPDDALAYMKDHYDDGLVIVEVNTDYWKLSSGFTGAMHIPHDQMAERYNEIPSGVPVILHCGAGVVSVPAYETLMEKRPDIPQLSYIAGHPPVQEFNAWLESHLQTKGE